MRETYHVHFTHANPGSWSSPGDAVLTINRRPGAPERLTRAEIEGFRDTVKQSAQVGAIVVIVNWIRLADEA